MNNTNDIHSLRENKDTTFPVCTAQKDGSAFVRQWDKAQSICCQPTELISVPTPTSLQGNIQSLINPDRMFLYPTCQNEGLLEANVETLSQSTRGWRRECWIIANRYRRGETLMFDLGIKTMGGTRYVQRQMEIWILFVRTLYNLICVLRNWMKQEHQVCFHFPPVATCGVTLKCSTGVFLRTVDANHSDSSDIHFWYIAEIWCMCKSLLRQREGSSNPCKVTDKL